jgi:hypothetical protein
MMGAPRKKTLAAGTGVIFLIPSRLASFYSARTEILRAIYEWLFLRGCCCGVVVAGLLLRGCCCGPALRPVDTFYSLRTLAGLGIYSRFTMCKMMLRPIIDYSFI